MNTSNIKHWVFLKRKRVVPDIKLHSHHHSDQNRVHTVLISAGSLQTRRLSTNSYEPRLSGIDQLLTWHYLQVRHADHFE
jgi:hypothetical protein